MTVGYLSPERRRMAGGSWIAGGARRLGRRSGGRAGRCRGRRGGSAARGRADRRRGEERRQDHGNRRGRRTVGIARTRRRGREEVERVAVGVVATRLADSEVEMGRLRGTTTRGADHTEAVAGAEA